LCRFRKWVLRTNTELSAEQVALKYKQLWQVERVFRDVKSLLISRPIFHQSCCVL
jgi:IS4 transposase